MKLKMLFYPLAIASVIFSSSCDRTDASYVQPSCQFAPNQKTGVYSAHHNDKYWTYLDFSSEKWIYFRFIDKAFIDLCTSEKNGVNIRVRGKFMEVKGYIKITDKDSLEVPLVKTNLDSNTYSFDGKLDNIDLMPYFQNYPGRYTPVLYIKMPYDSHYVNWMYFIERLKFNMIGIEVTPTGTKTF
ncbi:hypothetical protein CAP35_11625 [Chitinophagaceae bacterium IBVUCB1]|nr:hypothetical protein CAP35_11625 [Chitinophagaceae bacterium IBVUCB1]